MVALQSTCAGTFLLPLLLPPQVAALQAELKRLQFESSMAEGHRMSMEEKLSDMSRKTEDADFSGVKAKAELNAAAQREELQREELQQAHARVQVCVYGA